MFAHPSRFPFRRKAAWEAKKATMPGKSGSTTGTPAPATAALFGDDSDEPTGLGPAFEQKHGDAAEEYARKVVEQRRRRQEHERMQAEEEDALDVFMDAEVLPEVAAKEEEVRCNSNRRNVNPFSGCMI
jgi:hypothetical protein